jgi:hypothetical protein
MHNINVIIQSFINFGRRVAHATKVCAAAREICAFPASNSLPIAQLSPRNLRWHLGFLEKMCTPDHYRRCVAFFLKDYLLL